MTNVTDQVEWFLYGETSNFRRNVEAVGPLQWQPCWKEVLRFEKIVHFLYRCSNFSTVTELWTRNTTWPIKDVPAATWMWVGPYSITDWNTQVATDYLSKKPLTAVNLYPFTGTVRCSLIFQLNMFQSSRTCRLEVSGPPLLSAFNAEYTASDDPEILEQLNEEMEERVRRGPVAVGFANSDQIYAYGSGVFDGACGNTINHAVVIVGFMEDYWIVRNRYGHLEREGQGSAGGRPGENRDTSESDGPPGLIPAKWSSIGQRPPRVWYLLLKIMVTNILTHEKSKIQWWHKRQLGKEQLKHQHRGKEFVTTTATRAAVRWTRKRRSGLKTERPLFGLNKDLVWKAEEGGPTSSRRQPGSSGHSRSNGACSLPRPSMSSQMSQVSWQGFKDLSCKHRGSQGAAFIHISNPNLLPGHLPIALAHGWTHLLCAILFTFPLILSCK